MVLAQFVDRWLGTGSDEAESLKIVVATILIILSVHKATTGQFSGRCGRHVAEIKIYPTFRLLLGTSR